VQAFFLLLLFCLFELTGCVYYGDIHGYAKPLIPAHLSPKTISKTKNDTCCWWDRFHDPALNQLIEIALKDSPTMQTAEARLRKSESISKGTASFLWPTIDLSGYLEKERFSKTGIVPPPFNGKTFNIAELGLNFNYEFDFWGKNREALRATLSENEAFKADLKEAALVLSSSVANTYFELLATHATKEILKANLKDFQEINDIILTRATHGVDSDIPVKTAVGNLQAAELQVLQYEQSEKILRHQLAILLGKNPFETNIVIGKFSYHDIPLPKPLTANILAQRPDIHAALARTQAASHRINVNKARFFPNINLTGLLSFQSIFPEKLFNSDNQNNAIGGAIDLPIFDAGLRRANLGEAYAEYDISVDSYNNTLLNALREVADQNTNLQSLQSQLMSERKALNAATHNYQLLKSRYAHGIVDYVQVLEIKELVWQEEITLVNLEAKHLLATVAMLKALGGPL
jgi:NodT family efflux transporter outer membrane factor (OMF) lipoprotein